VIRLDGFAQRQIGRVDVFISEKHNPRRRRRQDIYYSGAPPPTAPTDRLNREQKPRPPKELSRICPPGHLSCADPTYWGGGWVSIKGVVHGEKRRVAPKALYTPQKQKGDKANERGRR